MVTHAELVSAFGEDSVYRMPPESAERFFARPEDRRLLTEVGMPRSLLGQLYFDNVARETPETLADALGPAVAGDLPPQRRDDLVIAAGMGGFACLSQADTSVYWWEPGTSERTFALVNSSFERFVETTYRARLAFKGFDLLFSAEDEESPEEIGEETRRDRR
jgi:hypothetical protein